MKLFLISQSQNSDYDTFDSAVVAAPDEQTARCINPNNGQIIKEWKNKYSDEWCDAPEHVYVKYIGDAAPDTEQGVICASFNAG